MVYFWGLSSIVGEQSEKAGSRVWGGFLPFFSGGRGWLRRIDRSGNLTLGYRM